MAFNPNAHGDMGGFEPLPAGDYVCVVISTEKKQTKAKTGHYLSVEFQVVVGEFAGKKLWANMNLDNPNQKAVEIAHRELATLCRAAGVAGLSDEWHPYELGNKTVICKVGVDSEGRNKIKYYDSANVAASAGFNAPPPPAESQAPDEDLPF